MKTIDVTCAVIEKEGKILIARRDHKIEKGKWEFPGGKVEEGESYKECLKRELREELEIEVEVDELLLPPFFNGATSNIKLFVYKTRYISGDIKMNVHDKILWVYPKDLHKYDFLDADIHIINCLNKSAS